MFRPNSITSAFPNLVIDGWLATSGRSIDYNCIAWAAGDDTQRWDVDDSPFLRSYWPPGIPKKWTKANLIRVFTKLGYRRCSDGGHEPGFEKVAIYELNRKPTHAARQLQDGLWTSKLGDEEDITHTLAGLEGDEYGKPTVFLKRATS